MPSTVTAMLVKQTLGSTCQLRAKAVTLATVASVLAHSTMDRPNGEDAEPVAAHDAEQEQEAGEDDGVTHGQADAGSPNEEDAPPWTDGG